MCSLLKTLWPLMAVLHISASLIVKISDPHIKVFDNSNISLTCSTEPPENYTSNDLRLSVRARMVLTFLQIPRGGQLHQVYGILHCDPARTNCFSEFNLAVECVTARINISQPIDTLETACQLSDDQVCSYEWHKLNRFDCVAFGTVTIIKGPKLHEKCIHRNQTVDQLLPCGDQQYCDTRFGICQCVDGAIAENRKCVPIEPIPEKPTPEADELELSPTESSDTGSVTTLKTAGVLPTLTTDSENGKQSNRKTSKALVIFLLILAILLFIALAVVVIWSRNRSRAVAANISN